MAQPEFWNDPARAGHTLRARHRVESEIEAVERLERELEEIEILLDLAQEDEAFLQELRERVSRVAAEIAEMELKALLSGEHDAGNAIVTITAGAGGDRRTRLGGDAPAPLSPVGGEARL